MEYPINRRDPTLGTPPPDREDPRVTAGIPGNASYSRGQGMPTDNINMYRGPSGQMWNNYLAQFQAQNPVFRPMQYYPGSTVADVNPSMREALNAQQFAGTSMQRGGSGMMDYGRLGMAMGGPEQVLGAGQQGANIGQYAANYGQGFTGRMMDTVGGQGSLNQGGLDQGMFNSIANNPALEGQINAISKDIMRNTSENVIPGIATSAVGTGNPYATRTQHAYDTALRQSREAVGDVAAELRYKNFGDARSQTLAMQGQNQQAELARRGLGVNAMAQGGQLGMQGLQMGMGGQFQMADLTNQVGQQGIQNQLAGMGAMGQGASMLSGRGQWMQDYNQAQLDDQVARFQFNQTSPFYTMPLYANALAAPPGMPFVFGSQRGGGASPGPNLGNFNF